MLFKKAVQTGLERNVKVTDSLMVKFSVDPWSWLSGEIRTSRLSHSSQFGMQLMVNFPRTIDIAFTSLPEQIRIF